MKRIIRLTESDLAKIVKRVLKEQQTEKGKTHSAMSHLEDVLTPFGFSEIKEFIPGVLGISKGDDCNGAHITFSQKSGGVKIQLYVSESCKTIIDKEYKAEAPNYTIDHNKILRDLGKYKTYVFKKTTQRG
jgi:hypothetical protein